jgi:hypothetical protein
MATAKKTTTARKPRARSSGKAVASTSFVAITDEGYRVVPVGEELSANDALVPSGSAVQAQRPGGSTLDARALRALATLDLVRDIYGIFGV